MTIVLMSDEHNRQQTKTRSEQSAALCTERSNFEGAFCGVGAIKRTTLEHWELLQSLSSLQVDSRYLVSYHLHPLQGYSLYSVFHVISDSRPLPLRLFPTPYHNPPLHLLPLCLFLIPTPYHSNRQTTRQFLSTPVHSQFALRLYSNSLPIPTSHNSPTC